MEKSSNIKSRRNFLKLMGAGAIAGAATACGFHGTSEKEDKNDNQNREMTYRTNHNTEDKVSILGYGMMRLPTIKSGKEGKETETIDQEEVNRLIDYAMANGVNYYDTSPVYMEGKSEESTGIALSRYPRDKYFIATKLSNFSPESQSREKSIEMFENSLKYLRTDYIDYLLLHAIGGGGMPEFNNRYINNGILDYLLEQKKKGRIRNLGFSFHGDVEVYDTMLKWMDEGKIHWDFVQIQLNYVDWNVEKSEKTRNVDAEYLYNELKKRNIPAVIMEPLLGGRLADVPQSVLTKMKQLNPEDTPAEWAFRFAGSPDGILTVLSGMKYMDHLTENVATYSPLRPVSDTEKQFLKDCASRINACDLVPCTGCQYCMPCPYGVDIPSVFRHYNKCVNSETMAWDRMDPDYAANRKAYLVGYDRSIPRLRQADYCIRCGSCVSHCPQEIKIPEELGKIADYTEKLRYSDI